MLAADSSCSTDEERSAALVRAYHVTKVAHSAVARPTVWNSLPDQLRDSRLYWGQFQTVAEDILYKQGSINANLHYEDRRTGNSVSIYLGFYTPLETNR